MDLKRSLECLFWQGSSKIRVNLGVHEGPGGSCLQSMQNQNDKGDYARIIITRGLCAHNSQEIMGAQ